MYLLVDACVRCSCWVSTHWVCDVTVKLVNAFQELESASEGACLDLLCRHVWHCSWVSTFGLSV